MKATTQFDELQRLRRNRDAAMANFDELYAEEVQSEAVVHAATKFIQIGAVLILLAIASMLGICARFGLSEVPQ